jgi:prephenate dehydratase
MDYSTKTGGVLPIEFELSDNIDNDIEKIKKIYSKFKGKYPEKGVL